MVRVLLDYLDHVTLCSKLKAVLAEQEQWADICRVQGEGNSNITSGDRKHQPAALLPVVHRKRPLPAAPLPPADPSVSRSAPAPVPGLHELRAAARAAEGLHPVPGVRVVEAAVLSPAESRSPESSSP